MSGKVIDYVDRRGEENIRHLRSGRLKFGEWNGEFRPRDLSSIAGQKLLAICGSVGRETVKHKYEVITAALCSSDLESLGGTTVSALIDRETGLLIIRR